MSGNNKYGARKTLGRDGTRYDSKAEADRAVELALLERAGEIRDLKRQQQFLLTVNGHLIRKWKCDFTYFDIKDEQWTADEVKGYAARDWPIVAKLFCALFPEWRLLVTAKKKKT